MTLLPIIGRELRLRARSRATYWSRFAVALLGVLICVPEMVLSGPFSSSAVTGRRVFDGVIGVAFLLSCSACLVTADLISAERREGTLGLLFLTRIKRLDVLLGKLGSVGITSLCALVAFLPVLMLPVLAGGVTGGEAFRKGLALFGTLWFALAAGVCGSTGQQERLRAVRGAVLLVAGGVLVPFVPFAISAAGVVRCIGWFSPLSSMISAGDVAYKASPAFYWASLVAVQGMAGLLLVAASIRLRRAMREVGAEVVRPPAAPAEAEKTLGLCRWQPVKADASPIEWLVYRQHGVSAGMWAPAVVALAYSGLVFWAHQPFAPAAAASSVLLAWPLGVAAALLGGALVVWMASRFFAGVRRTGDLELLLTTPLGAESILADQWNVFKRLFVRTVPLLQAAMLLPVLGATASTTASPLSGWQAHNTIATLLSLTNTLLGTVALCWLALWFALKARSQAGAIVWTVGLAKGVPCVLSVVGDVLCGLLFGGSATPPGLPGAVISWLPEVVVLLFYVWLIRLARQRLRETIAGHEPSPFDWRLQPGWSGIA